MDVQSRRVFFACLVLTTGFTATGCVLGPSTLRFSRTNYNRAIQQTAREEMLLNLVRLRYNQSVEFLRIPSITGQYSYDAEFGATGRWQEAVPNILGLAFGFGMQSKPTIVYAPEQEQEFNRRLLSPISVETLDLLGSKGWSVDRVLRLTVRNINDVDNATPAGGPTPRRKPEFEEFRYVTNLLRRLQMQSRGFEFAHDQVITSPKQLSDPIPIAQVDGEDVVLAAKEGFQFRISTDNKTAALWTSPSGNSVEVLRFREDVRNGYEVQEFCRILELDPTLPSYRIKTDAEGQLQRPHSRRTGTAGPQDRQELIVSTRSFKESMYYLSHVIEVPESHYEKGFVRETLDEDGNRFDWKEMVGDLFQVHYSRLPPRNTAVSVKHRGHWFYVDDSDISSKATFNLLLELFNLEIRAGGGAQIPLLTI